jgi:hypothetical protein
VLSRTRATEPLADTMPEPTELAALLVERLGVPAAELLRRSFE